MECVRLPLTGPTLLIDANNIDISVNELNVLLNINNIKGVNNFNVVILSIPISPI